MKAKIILIALLLATCILKTESSTSVSVITEEQPSASQCSMVIYNMVSCLSYLVKSSPVPEPNLECCFGLELAFNTGFRCICIAMETSLRMGLDVNMTRADALSSTCAVSFPPLSHCNGSAHHLAPPTPPKPKPTPEPESPSMPPSGSVAVYGSLGFVVVMNVIALLCVF